MKHALTHKQLGRVGGYVPHYRSLWGKDLASRPAERAIAARLRSDEDGIWQGSYSGGWTDPPTHAPSGGNSYSRLTLAQREYYIKHNWYTPRTPKWWHGVQVP